MAGVDFDPRAQPLFPGILIRKKSLLLRHKFLVARKYNNIIFTFQSLKTKKYRLPAPSKENITRTICRDHTNNENAQATATLTKPINRRYRIKIRIKTKSLQTQSKSRDRFGPRQLQTNFDSTERRKPKLINIGTQFGFETGLAIAV